MDGQLDANLDKPEQLAGPFKSWFRTWAAERDHPAKVTVSTTVEKH